jgi:hypothetical protein
LHSIWSGLFINASEGKCPFNAINGIIQVAKVPSISLKENSAYHCANMNKIDVLLSAYVISIIIMISTISTISIIILHSMSIGKKDLGVLHEGENAQHCLSNSNILDVVFTRNEKHSGTSLVSVICPMSTSINDNMGTIRDCNTDFRMNAMISITSENASFS